MGTRVSSVGVIKDSALMSVSGGDGSSAMQATTTDIFLNYRNRAARKVQREARIEGLMRVSARNLQLACGSRVSTAEAAQRAAMSERTFLRRFKQTLGVSPREFLRRARLERACSLLAQTDLPIEKIARQAGFVGRNCMANLFRRHLATTPTEYRAGVRSTTGGLFNCPTQACAVETTQVQLKSEV
jgi:transcriptional regulator GlxA family with amidase domain